MLFGGGGGKARFFISLGGLYPSPTRGEGRPFVGFVVRTAILGLKSCNLSFPQACRLREIRTRGSHQVPLEPSHYAISCCLRDTDSPAQVS